MPIKDIQTQDQRLSRLGNIRLGVKKIHEKSGKSYPVESPHFVLVDAPEVADAYGNQPTELLIYLPFATTDGNLTAYHELWGGGYCKCRGDGEKIIDLLDPSGINKLVRDGRVIKPFQTGANVTYQEGDVLPCPGMKHDTYERCAECKPSALLMVMVRDPGDPGQLVGDRLGYYQIRTNSYRNIQNLTAQLRFVEDRSQQAGRTLQGIPMILKRIQQDVSYVATDKDTKEQVRRTTPKYFLDLEFDIEWVRRSNDAMRQHAMFEDGRVLELPYSTVDGDYTEEDNQS